MKIRQPDGFSIVELMITTAIGLIISLAIMEIYLAQSQLYKTNASQSLIQSTQNALTNLVTPIIRSAGFTGCGSIATSVSNLNPGGAPPIGALNTTQTMVMGYDGGTSNITITQQNSANSNTASNWTPTLDATLVGNVEAGNDVLIVLGSAPGSYPIPVTTITPGSNSFTVQGTSGVNLAAGQFGSVSDCLKTSVFQITNVTGTTITHDVGAGQLQNANSTFSVDYQPGCQFIPLQQTAFFVGQGTGGQSALMQATLSNSGWIIQPLVPGIDLMKVLYGIGANGTVTQYVPASSVANWSQVYAIRIAFLIEGQQASGNTKTTQYTVLNTIVTVPADNRLRHVFEITINLRDALS
jgi:type IV pilus assembly protein PilW